MKETTLVLGPRYDEDSQALWQAARSRGWDVARIGYNRSGEFGNRERAMRGRLVLYGGYIWGPHVAKRLGVELQGPPDDWITRVPEQFRGRRVWISTVGAVRGGPFPIFLKSAEGKQLASCVYHAPEDIPDVGDETAVIAQEPVHWSAEWRLFVDEQGIHAWSRYAVDGDLACEPTMDRECRRIYERLLAAECVLGPLALDVGLIEGRGFAVVEANPAWCSGLYACDSRSALDVIMCASGAR